LDAVGPSGAFTFPCPCCLIIVLLAQLRFAFLATSNCAFFDRLAFVTFVFDCRVEIRGQSLSEIFGQTRVVLQEVKQPNCIS
jgi:hypothetical protein